MPAELPPDAAQSTGLAHVPIFQFVEHATPPLSSIAADFHWIPVPDALMFPINAVNAIAGYISIASDFSLVRDSVRNPDLPGLQVSVLPPEYPGWMLPFQGADRLAPVDRWALLRKTDKAS